MIFSDHATMKVSMIIAIHHILISIFHDQCTSKAAWQSASEGNINQNKSVVGECLTRLKYYDMFCFVME